MRPNWNSQSFKYDKVILVLQPDKRTDLKCRLEEENNSVPKVIEARRGNQDLLLSFLNELSVWRRDRLNREQGRKIIKQSYAKVGQRKERKEARCTA